MAGVVTGSAGVRCLCERVKVRACVFIEQARQKAEALAGWILGETGSILGWLDPVEASGMCRLLEAREELFFLGVPRAGEDLGARGVW